MISYLSHFSEIMDKLKCKTFHRIKSIITHSLISSDHVVLPHMILAETIYTNTICYIIIFSVFKTFINVQLLMENTVTVTPIFGKISIYMNVAKNAPVVFYFKQFFSLVFKS